MPGVDGQKNGHNVYYRAGYTLLAALTGVKSRTYSYNFFGAQNLSGARHGIVKVLSTAPSSVLNERIIHLRLRISYGLTWQGYAKDKV